MKSFAKLKSGFDGRRPCDHRKGLMHARLSTLRRLLYEINRGQAKRIRLLEGPGSPLHEWDTNFIGNSERRFPAVFRASIDLEWKSKLAYLIWQLPQETLFPVLQELHWNLWLCDHRVRLYFPLIVLQCSKIYDIFWISKIDQFHQLFQVQHF